MWFSNINNDIKTPVKIKALKNKIKTYYYSKAPMAHKTRSHEKYLKKNYLYSFIIRIDNKNSFSIKNVVLSFFLVNFFFNKISSNLISINNYKLPINFTINIRPI